MPRSASLKSGATTMVSSTKIPTVSLWDSLFYNLVHVLPAYLRGLFTPNRFWVTFWNAVHPDPAAVKFVSRLRRKYHSDYLYLYVMTKKSLLVLDKKGIKQVLDNSPEIYADAKMKRVGMSHFQPNAVTISRYEEWRDRRRFNQSVLNTGQGLHQYAKEFLHVIKAETTATLAQAHAQLDWNNFSKLFENISLQIIFGRGVKDSSSLRALRHMMHESNKGFALKKSKYFDAFYTNVRRRREDAYTPSLAFLCKHVQATDMTKVDNQIPHWMFAMADTLPINTARALALIVAHPDAEAHVREEMQNVDIDTAEGIHSLRYLEGCVQEAMRLWPTTPLLVRETLKEDSLAGATIPAATQVVIMNSFNHRDRDSVAYADTFSPHVWLDMTEADYQFNHLSNGRQVCAGKDLALFIAKAVLANLLATHRYELKRPSLNLAAPLPYSYNHFQLTLKLKEA